MPTRRQVTAARKSMRGSKHERQRALRSLAVLGSVLILAIGGMELVRALRRDEPVVARPHYKVGAPYWMNGVWYRPAEDLAYRKTGIASYYGGETRGLDFHGRLTANGEIYDMNTLTAAHPTLPMPSLVSVTNLENGRSVVLRVNDRGPYFRGRIIDVSRRAAQILGFEENGTARVRVEILAAESRALKHAMLRGEPMPMIARNALEASESQIMR